MTRSRVMQSEYMHWAKTRRLVRFDLASSQVPDFRLDSLPITLADLELDGASRFRYAPLREAIAGKEGVTPDRVVMANGTSMANYLALAALLEPGDEVLVEEPTYEPMLATVLNLGARVVRFQRRAEDGFRLDADAVARAVTRDTRLILLANLHNPSGDFADDATLRRIVELGPRILIDEVYLDAAPGAHSCVHLDPSFVATSSLTKVYGLPGLRCGWILAEPALAERMWRLNELMGVAQPHADEMLCCIALAHLGQVAGGLPEHLARNRALANAFFASRPELEVAPIEHGITAFPRLVEGNVDRLCEQLVEQYDTIVVPGRWFERPDHFRVGIGGATEILEGGLERLGAALDTFA